MDRHTRKNYAYYNSRKKNFTVSQLYDYMSHHVQVVVDSFLLETMHGYLIYDAGQLLRIRQRVSTIDLITC